jgi:hypothetical protein
MEMALSILLRREQGSPVFDFAFSAVGLALVAGLILWHRRYGRIWRQYRARDWRQVMGIFDEGEIVVMRKGESQAIAGYQVWLGYNYQADGEQTGLFYTLPFSGEFPSKDEAEQWRRLVANQSIVVRVSPSNPKRSCVLDVDVRPMVSGRNFAGPADGD